MREIKFRGMMNSRFPELNKMAYGTGIYKDGINTWLVAHDDTKCLADGLIHNIIDENTIGQYTGLKDKNGKEIYEGDIVKRFAKIMRVEYGEFTTGPDSASCGIGFYLTPNDIYPDENLYEADELIEVIGNIYENPEKMQEVK